MHSPSARALRHLDRYYIILVRTLKHLIPAKCAINITYMHSLHVYRIAGNFRGVIFSWFSW